MTPELRERIANNKCVDCGRYKEFSRAILAQDRAKGYTIAKGAGWYCPVCDY